MSKHTPGPWKPRKISRGDGFFAFTVDSAEVEICEIYEKPNAAEVNEANAQLIAAAPDLLEALKTLVSNAYGTVNYSVDAVARMVHAAEAAIVKAEGK